MLAGDLLGPCGHHVGERLVYMNLKHSRSQVDEGATVGSCRINRLLFADDLVLLASSQHSLQHVLDRFSAACDRAGMKISTKITEVLCFSTNPRQCMLRAAIHCKRWSSSTQGWYLRVAEGGAKRLIHGLVKLMQFWVSFIALRSQNGSFQTPQSCQFSIGLCFDPYLSYGQESWVKTERISSLVQPPEMGFLRRVHGVTQGCTMVEWRTVKETSLALPCSSLRSSRSKCRLLYWRKNLRHCWDFSVTPVIRRPGHFAPLVWHFATKCAAVEFVEPWISNHFSELKDHSYVASAMCPECPTKDWRGKSCWLAKPTGRRSRDRPRPRWWDCISNLAWPRLGVGPAELSEFAVDVRYSVFF